MTYNGWTNHATWLVNLWISEGVLGDPQEVDEQARHFAETDEESAAYDMAGWLKEQVENATEQEQASSLSSDLIGAALATVNFMEIAKHFTDEAIQNEAEQTANANA